MAGILHIMTSSLGGSSGLNFFVDYANINVHNLLLASGWDGVTVVNPIVTIGEAAKIYSLDTAIASFDTGLLVPGSAVSLFNNGAIIGKGGDGGRGGYLGAALDGFDGGPALIARVPTTITNLGTIAGGGGGGGGGGGAGYPYTLGGGGGGGGIGISLGGDGYTKGFPGGLLTYGAGGRGMPSHNNGASAGGYGGRGGSFGEAGTNGGSGASPYLSIPTQGGIKGQGGNAVEGDSNITWLVTGTIYGDIIS